MLAIVLAVSLGSLSACTGGSNGNNTSGGGSGSGSGSGSAETETLKGTTSELLSKLFENTQAQMPAGNVLPAGLDDKITAENCLGMLGLTPQQLEQYVEEATVSQAAITSIAHQVALVKCKSSADAKTVKQLIADGFDSGRWICVFPEQSLVQESGSYVLLVASSKVNVEALKAGFSELAKGNVGTPVVFYTGTD
jgi:hypothetical protein